MSNSSLGAVGLLGGFFVTFFVTLKLLGVITWSWGWVTAPFWGGLLVVIAFLLLCWVLIMRGSI